MSNKDEPESKDEALLEGSERAPDDEEHDDEMLDEDTGTDPSDEEEDPGDDEPEAGEPEAGEPEAGEPEEDDWEARVLCPDDTCIGTMDPQGVCRICGALGEPGGGSRNEGSDREAEGEIPRENADGEKSKETSSKTENTADPGPEDDDDDWHSRELCPDETCIGTLDPDGGCRVCGKRP